MSSLIVFLVIFSAPNAFAGNLRENEVASVGETHMTYSMWLKLCETSEKRFKERQDEAVVESASVAKSSKGSVVQAFESFKARVSKVTISCQQLVSLPNTPTQLAFKGQPDEANELDKSARFIGRQIMHAIISAQNQYIIYKVVLNSDKENPNYVDAADVIEKYVLHLNVISSSIDKVKNFLLVPAVLAIHSVLF
ncbi:hypothetical protein BBBOND_0207020 [Babesia bigemina]|uniref:Uncharacterized protein n=1 Tax=Babesia bigemina TaxID=5866 RepID=A0A061D9D9_BABBI|nr:hypothetical protein BBBOND_0207020 [Babesia bigemina]CDR95544.1 hypothetical protein BBBOND_0207020 [Babesia bigemina]|eukprot:XP_012767730.1 hypothetical protein BBBOND_0207020 [Babesia bigemina]